MAITLRSETFRDERGKYVRYWFSPVYWHNNKVRGSWLQLNNQFDHCRGALFARARGTSPEEMEKTDFL
jgi:hypothetical protein